jgi:hypothetical protein
MGEAVQDALVSAAITWGAAPLLFLAIVIGVLAIGRLLPAAAKLSIRTRIERALRPFSGRRLVFFAFAIVFVGIFLWLPLDRERRRLDREASEAARTERAAEASARRAIVLAERRALGAAAITIQRRDSGRFAEWHIGLAGEPWLPIRVQAMCLGSRPSISIATPRDPIDPPRDNVAYLSPDGVEPALVANAVSAVIAEAAEWVRLQCAPR